MTITYKRFVGNLGEGYACNFLKDSGFKIIQRNYLRKWGEIDIIAEKKGILHFVEVKTITSDFYFNGTDWYRPEDNMHRWKINRLKKAIQSYLLEEDISYEKEWEFSLITVVMKRKTNELYKLEFLENLII